MTRPLTETHWTDQELELLKLHYKPARDIAKQLSQTILPRFSPRQISGKAHRLSLSHKRWSDEEEELLEAVAETMPLDELCLYWRRQAEKRGFPVRTKGGLHCKLHQMGYGTHSFSGWNAKVLARGLGVAPSTVFSWIKSGKLKTKWVGEEGGERLITPKQLRNFTSSYPGEFRTLRMDGDGFAWLLQAISEVK